MPRLAWQCLIYLALIAVDAAALRWMGSSGLYVCAVVAVPIGFTAAWLEPQREGIPPIEGGSPPT